MTMQREKLILAGMITAFTAVIFAIACNKYANFGYNGFDLAIYNQTFWNTVHGHWFAGSINPPSYLGDHAEWLILALAPFYALVPHPLTLVLLQTLAIALSAVPIWMIARARSNDPRFCLLFPLVWLVNPIVWNLTLFEFHLIAFAVPTTFFAAYFFIKNKWPAFMAMTGLILLTREDMAFVVLGFALMAVPDLARKRKKIGAWLCWALVPVVLSVVVFLIDQRVISHFNPDGAYKFFTYYSWLGKTPLDIAANGFWHPLKIVAHILRPQNFQIVFVFLATVLFLPLFRPRWLLLCLAVVFEYLLTGEGMTGTIVKTQYAAGFLPALMLSSIEGYERLIASGRAGRFFPKRLLPVLLLVAAAHTWFFFGPGTGIAKGFAPGSARAQTLRAAVALVPADATVVSSMDTITALSSRSSVWPMSYVWINKKQFGTSSYDLPADPEYLIVDQQDFVYFFMVYPHTYFWDLPEYRKAPERFRAFLEKNDYGPIFNQNGVAVLKKGAGGPWPFAARYRTEPPIANPADKKIRPLVLKGWEQAGPELHLFFSADGPVENEYALFVNKKCYPLGNGFYPTTEWKKGETIEVMLPVADAKYEISLTTVPGGLGLDGIGGLYLQPDSADPAGETITIP